MILGGFGLIGWNGEILDFLKIFDFLRFLEVLESFRVLGLFRGFEDF